MKIKKHSKFDPNRREFEGIWIPKKIWIDKKLSPLEKILYAEVKSFCDEKKGCFASNEYLAGVLQISVSRLVALLSNLRKLGYIRTKSFDGRVRYLEICK